jgi:hypothetical protein
MLNLSVRRWLSFSTVVTNGRYSDEQNTDRCHDPDHPKSFSLGGIHELRQEKIVKQAASQQPDAENNKQPANDSHCIPRGGLFSLNGLASL